MKTNEYMWFVITIGLVVFLAALLLTSAVQINNNIKVVQSALDNLAEKPSCWLLENGKHIGVGKIDGSCEAWVRERIQYIVHLDVDGMGYDLIIKTNETKFR